MMTTTITAKDVAELRQRTGAGMMDCKKALEETGGDMDAAVEYLRKNGMAKAEKRADRSTSEGIVGGDVLNDGALGVLVEVGVRDRLRRAQRRLRQVRRRRSSRRWQRRRRRTPTRSSRSRSRATQPARSPSS